jgi:peptidoglycan-associated lipoprotein
MNSRIVWRCLALASVATLGAACAQEGSPYKSPWDSQHGAASGSITTTTGAPVARPTGGGLAVSEELMKSCRIHFDNVEQAPKFDFDRSDLSDQDRAILQQIATCVTTGPLAGRHVSLTGRADPRGEVEYNLGLGAHPATSVAVYLEHLGVGSSSISETSRGKLDATGTDESSWRRDRRVDIDVK